MCTAGSPSCAVDPSRADGRVHSGQSNSNTAQDERAGEGKPCCDPKTGPPFDCLQPFFWRSSSLSQPSSGSLRRVQNENLVRVLHRATEAVLSLLWGIRKHEAACPVSPECSTALMMTCSSSRTSLADPGPSSVSARRSRFDTMTQADRREVDAVGAARSRSTARHSRARRVEKRRGGRERTPLQTLVVAGGDSYATFCSSIVTTGLIRPHKTATTARTDEDRPSRPSPP